MEDRIYPTCETCKFCLPVFCHPWNDKVGKGNMTEQLGYVCILFTEFAMCDENKAVFMDDNNGMCECHTVK